MGPQRTMPRPARSQPRGFDPQFTWATRGRSRAATRLAQLALLLYQQAAMLEPKPPVTLALVAGTCMRARRGCCA